jgi:predicted nucleic acid-binding protein
LIYLDSSCIVKLIIAEAESEALHALLVDEGTPSTFTSQLAVTEVKRALHAQGETELAASVAALPGHLQVPGQTILARPATGDMFSAAGDLLPGSALRSLARLVPLLPPSSRTTPGWRLPPATSA